MSRSKYDPKSLDPKPPRQRRLHRVESFGPKVLAILLHGARQQSEFSAPWNQVIQLIQRINQLREAMHREEHPQYPMVAKVQVWMPDYPNPAVKPPEGKYQIVRAIIGTRDAKFDSIIEQLGIDVGLGNDASPSSLLSSAGESLEDLLAQTPSKRKV